MTHTYSTIATSLSTSMSCLVEFIMFEVIVHISLLIAAPLSFVRFDNMFNVQDGTISSDKDSNEFDECVQHHQQSKNNLATQQF